MVSMSLRIVEDILQGGGERINKKEKFVYVKFICLLWEKLFFSFTLTKLIFCRDKCSMPCWRLSTRLQQILSSTSLASLARSLAGSVMLLSDDLLLKMLPLIRWRWTQTFEISPELRNTKTCFIQWISRMRSSSWTHSRCRWSLAAPPHRTDHLAGIFRSCFHYCHYFSLLLRLSFLARECLLPLLLL